MKVLSYGYTTANNWNDINLNDQLPKIEDPSDRVVQEMLIGYFYKGLQPDYLREKISHFKTSTIKQVFDVFREYPRSWEAGRLAPLQI